LIQATHKVDKLPESLGRAEGNSVFLKRYDVEANGGGVSQLVHRDGQVPPDKLRGNPDDFFRAITVIERPQVSNSPDTRPFRAKGVL